MYISSFHIEGLKWLDIRSGISSIEIHPNNQIQILTGMNGGGKSALFSQLSPLPAMKNDYKSLGGKKILTCVHKGSEYVISSVKKGNQLKHSFVRDGEELNINGLSNMQTDLCEKHLGYTAQIDNLLHCRYKMTQMSPTERKLLFLSLAPTISEYVIDLHKKAKSAVRSYKANYAMLAKKKQELENQLVTEEELLEKRKLKDELMTEKMKLHNEFYLLKTKISEIETKVLDCRITKDFSTEDFNAVSKMKRKMQTLIYQLSPMTMPTIKDEWEYINSTLTKLQTEKQHLDNRYESLSKEMVELEAYKNALSQTDASDENYIRMKTIALKSLLQWKKYPWLNNNEEDIEHHKKVFDQINDIISSISESLSSYQEIFMRDSAIAKLNAKLTYIRSCVNRSIQVQITENENILNDIQEQEKSLPTIPSIKLDNCKTCGYKQHFASIMASLSSRAKLAKTELQRLEKQLAKCAKVESNLSSILDILKMKDSIIDQISSLLKKTCWTWSIQEIKHLVFMDPGYLLSWMKNTLLAQDKWKEIQELEKEIQTASNRIEFLKTKKIPMGKLFDNLYIEKQKELSDIKTVILSIAEKYEVFRKRKEIIDQVRTLKRQIESVQNELDSWNRKSIFQMTLSFLKNDVYPDMKKSIDGIDSRYDELCAILHKQESLLVQYNDSICAMLGTTEERMELFTYLEAGLSPESGMPRKQLVECLETIRDNVNFILERIWTSPFQVQLVSDVSDTNNNCDFLASVNNKPATQLNKLSKSEQAVVNFAFYIALIYASGATDYPVYFDECDDGFDSFHKVTYLEWIKSYMESAYSPQLWMICHDSAIYSGFLYRDLICLNDPKVHPDSYIPGETNKHVTIVRH